MKSKEWVFLFQIYKLRRAHHCSTWLKCQWNSMDLNNRNFLVHTMMLSNQFDCHRTQPLINHTLWNRKHCQSTKFQTISEGTTFSIVNLESNFWTRRIDTAIRLTKEATLNRWSNFVHGLGQLFRIAASECIWLSYLFIYSKHSGN